jgi:hypothetical protein
MRLGAAMVVLLLGVGLLTAPAIAARHQAGHLLDTVEPDLKFTDVPLSDAIDFLRDSTQSNIVVDWKSLEAVNIDRNTLINVYLRNVTMRKALDIILSEAGAGNLLTFYVEDNVLQITTVAKADTELYTMVYPVKDLLVDTTPNFQLQDVTNVINSNSSGNEMVGAGQTGTTTTNNNNTSFSSSNSSSSTSTKTADERGADLVKLIMDTIRPEVWRENGGNSVIRFFNGNLIVTAPLSVQEAIGGPVN